MGRGLRLGASHPAQKRPAAPRQDPVPLNAKKTLARLTCRATDASRSHDTRHNSSRGAPAWRSRVQFDGGPDERVLEVVGDADQLTYWPANGAGPAARTTAD